LSRLHPTLCIFFLVSSSYHRDLLSFLHDALPIFPGKRGSSRTSRSPAFATATWGADGASRAQARRGRTGSGTEGGESLGCAAHHAMASSDDPRRIAPLPIAERIGADPRFTGKGVVAAFLDAGFYAHPDLTRPTSRILAYENLIHGFRGVEHL